MPAKTRSPRYPAIGLKEAIEKIKLIYERDYQNKVPKDVIARHLGYKGLNGKSLGVIAALSRFGLLEGRGDETRVSDLGLTIIAHDPGTPERTAAIQEAAKMPELFGELDAKFDSGQASDAAIRAYLLTQKFIPEAADNVIRSYRETKNVLAVEAADYALSKDVDESSRIGSQTYQLKPSLSAKSGMERADFPLVEGKACFEFPSPMSAESYSELEAWVALVLRRAKRTIQPDEGSTN